MVDALDTAVIMEQTDIVNIILDYIPKIDFTKNHSEKPVYTSLFETNIRYLGGLLSAYDLLKGPFSHLDIHHEHVDALLKQATSLADTVKFAFNTPSGIPRNYFYLSNHSFHDTFYIMNDGTPTAGLAEMGSLVLEWQHLSDLTGNPEYGNLAQRAESHWFNAAAAHEVWPGLTGSNFSVKTGELLDSYGGWTSGNDSAYEYLIKMYVYDPDRYANYSTQWQKAADSTLAHLLSHPSSRPDLTMATTWSAGQQTQNYSEQLACFIGGNFILGSYALPQSPNSEKYLETGLAFSDFCANGYRSTLSGIGPLIYSWDLHDLSNVNYTNQTSFYSKAGWFINDNTAFFNGQAPEAVESWYYAYQATKEQYWRDVAWAYTVAQNRTERIATGGFLSVENVFERDGGGHHGVTMASFLLAEVFKYQFLIQTERGGVWDVLYGEGKENHFVYNTECHPLAVAKKKRYGKGKGW